MLYEVITILGEMLIVGLTADSTSLLDLRTIADWSIRPRLLSTGGVAVITSYSIHYTKLYDTANALNAQLAHLKREELKRIQTQTGSIKVSMVYLTMIQEAQNVVTYTINLMKVNRKFQMDFEI